MKKLTRVVFIIALLAMVILPLSARKAMNVSWEWLLSDPEVTAYRYQLNGEAENGWTVVDGNTAAYTATGLDPYSDYTLYLQCSYDGVNWSESASSTAYALLSAEEESAVVEEAAVVEEPVAEEAVFSVFGFGIANRWTGSSFESTALDEGVFSYDDILGFIQYEAAKYPDLAQSVYFTVVDNGFVLTYEEGAVNAEYLLPQYEADLAEYVDSMLYPAAEEAVEEVAGAEAAAEEPTIVFADTLSYKGVTTTIVVDNTWATLTVPEGMDEEDVVAVAQMVSEEYPAEASLVTYSLEGDTVTLAYPEQSDEFLLSVLSVLREEAVELIDLIEASRTPALIEEAPAVEEVAEVTEAPEEAVAEEVSASAEPVEEAPAEEAKSEETPAPAVEVAPVKEETKKSKTPVKASFNISLNGGLEWGFGKVLTDGFSKNPTIYPFASLTLEGQNIIHFGAFGLGLRSDVSAVFIPESKNLSSNPSNVWGFDATADIKLMTYLNAGICRFYLGGGIGYSAASNKFTSVHSETARILVGVGGGEGFNTAFAVTGVTGIQFNLGSTVTLKAEGYARWFFDMPGKLDTLNVAATLGLGLKF